MTTIWGPHVWNFLHIFCEKVNSNKFYKKKEDIFDIIQNICENLPCPECSSDAKNLLNSYPLISNVKNKEDLKMYIYHFHNKINEKLIKENYIIEGLEKYKAGNLNISLNNYLLAIENNNKPNEKLLLHRFTMSRTIKKIKEFINNNNDLFE